MELELCVPCAFAMQEAFTVTKIANKREKITCRNCRRRRYGGVYKIANKNERKA